MITIRAARRHAVLGSVGRGLGIPMWTCVSLVALAAAMGLGCQKGDGWTPGPQETSTRFLEREVEEALAAVDEAQSTLRESPAAAGRSLDGARRSLLRLRAYYLPLLQARGGAYNALRWYHLGDSQRTLEELKKVESVLLRISDREDPQLSREVDPLLDTVVAARAAVRAGRTEASELIQSLGSRINLLLLKGDLALHGTQLEGR